MEFYHPLLDQMKNTEEAKKLRIEYNGDILTCAVIYFFSKKTISCYTNNITFSAIITHHKITAIFFFFEEFHQCMF